jgi:hypothetical protein
MTVFDKYTQLIRDAEALMPSVPVSQHKELYDIVEELVYMRTRLNEPTSELKTPSTIEQAMADHKFRHCIMIHDRLGAIRAFLDCRHPGRKEYNDYSNMAIEEASMYVEIAMDKQISEALEMEAEMQ